MRWEFEPIRETVAAQSVNKNMDTSVENAYYRSDNCWGFHYTIRVVLCPDMQEGEEGSLGKRRLPLSVGHVAGDVGSRGYITDGQCRTALKGMD